MTTETDPKGIGQIRYLLLCGVGQQTQQTIDSDIARRRKVSFLLMNAEDEHPANVPRYRDELHTLKVNVHNARGVLMQHVAHCTDGCVRDIRGGLSGSAFTNVGAPAHAKPELPRMAELAARLRHGEEAVEVIAAEYDRNPATIAQKIAAAGFNSRDGRPVVKKTEPAVPVRPVLPDEPWRDDALCAQTDPESFFPEKGGSTRDAKSVCSTCTVSAECLDYALEHDERHGIWGGLSERDRRKIQHALRAESA